MRRVFLIGAGASRELFFNIHHIDGGYGTVKTDRLSCQGPLSTGFIRDAEQLMHEVGSKLRLAVPAKLWPDILRFISVYAKAHPVDEAILQRINIEDLFRALEDAVEAEDASSPAISPRYIELFQAKTQLETYIAEVLSFISNYCYSLTHAVLAKHLIEEGGDIISFNWDLLLDEALAATGQWHYETGYGLRFKNVPAEGTPASRNLLLKPHGSINWYRPRDNDEPYLRIPEERRLRSGTVNRLRSTEQIDGQMMHGFIVPPGRKRLAFPDVWQHVKGMLEATEEVIAIGFSFNSNDGHIKESLRNFGFKESLKVRLVNPNGAALVQLYKEAFSTADVQVQAESFSEYCKSLGYNLQAAGFGNDTNDTQKIH